MSQLPFNTFFQTATGNPPYDYQSRLAGSDSGTACNSHQLIDILAFLCGQNRIVFAKD